jgi:KH/beta-lactamase-domain protein
MAIILQSLPEKAGLTRIEYEGPRIALYSKNPRYLLQNGQLVSNMVNTIKKRIVVRTDESIRHTEQECRQILDKVMPHEIGIVEAFFDPALGEAIVFAKRPWLLSQADEDFDNVDLAEKTGWKVRIRKSPRLLSPIRKIYEILGANSTERVRFYREVGNKIFRQQLDETAEASLITLGGFAEVGRSCMLLSTHESKVLLDCGINLAAKNALSSCPRFDISGLEMAEIDAIVLSHAHLDHTGFLPALFKYGYRGPVYCTEPTLFLMNLLQRNYLSSVGQDRLYSESDIDEMVIRTITLGYGVVTDISPDVKLVLSNSGHILGSASSHLHIGNGDHNLVYTGDIRFGRTMMLENASWNFPRVETMIIESTNGGKEDILPTREQAEAALASTISRTVGENGWILIPTPAAGTSQELLLCIAGLMKNKKIPETKVLVEQVISDATSVHEAYPEYLSKELKQQILSSEESPFWTESFASIESEKLGQGPGIVLAPSSMLTGGPSVMYLKQIAQDPASKLVLLSYQAPETLGRMIQDGAKKIITDSKEISLECQVEKIEGFSSHSDYNQLVAYINRLRPKLRRVLVNHGERYKAQNLASSINKMFKIQTQHPLVQEAIKLL